MFKKTADLAEDGSPNDSDNDSVDDDDDDNDDDGNNDVYEPSWAVVQISLWLRAPAPTFVKADTCIFCQNYLVFSCFFLFYVLQK